jgi:hypothetical protein
MFTMAAARFRPAPMHRFDGTAEAICHRVVAALWNGKFFGTGLGHFPDFWTRDFGLCVRGLLKAGYRTEVRSSLAFALDACARAGRVTTVVRANGHAQDIYGEPADAAPLLLHSLVALGDRGLVEQHKDFLARATSDFLLDFGSRPKEGFKDTVIRGLSTYELVMHEVILRAAEMLKIRHALSAFDFNAAPYLHRLWQSRYFRATPRSDPQLFSAEANLVPFLYSAVPTRGMVENVLDEIRERRLDEPFPLVFSDPPRIEPARFLPSLFAPGYQGNTIWSIFGTMAMLVARRGGSQASWIRYERATAAWIERHGTFYELFDREGDPYQSWLYRSCEGMLWAATYLEAAFL